MTLYFEIGYRSWVCVHSCIDWNDAISKTIHYFDLRQMRCLNKTDFLKLKENVVLTF